MHEPMNLALLGLSAKALDDFEALRIATENRIRQLTSSGEDADGEERGLGLPDMAPEVMSAKAILEGLKALEHQTTLDLQRSIRKIPIYPVIRDTKGLGEKTVARLLAATGDPYIATRIEKSKDGKIVSVDVSPRAKREFFAYCGYGIAPGGAKARSIPKGASQAELKALGNPEAKKRAYILVDPIIKNGGPYREVYDQARAKYENAIHAAECRPCAGRDAKKPLEAGTPLSKGHQHARAVRAVSKAILGDLWEAAREYHEGAAVAD